MTHFAKLDLNKKVVDIVVISDDITGERGDETEQLGVDYLTRLSGYPFWLQTSYDGLFRKKYAGIGDHYDYDRDSFTSPSPYPSWVFDMDTHQYKAPVPPPEGGRHDWDEGASSWVDAPVADADNSANIPHTWNEETTSWVEVQENN